MKIVFYAFCLSFIFGCNSSSKHLKNVDYVLDDFPKKINLESEELKISSVLLKIDELLVIDSLVVVYQNRKDTIFSIFQLPDLKHIHSFGSKGNGPNEFNLSFSATFGPVYGTANSTFAIGNKMTKVHYYRINDLLNKEQTPYKIASLPPKLNGFRAISYIGDTLIYGAPYGKTNIDIFKYTISDKKLDSYLEYPDDYPLISGEIKRGVYGCYMAAKPDRTKFARSYANMGIIEIYDISKDNHSPFVISYKDFPSLKENLHLDSSTKFPNHRQEQKIFSWGIRANDKYIYTLVYNDRYDKVVGEEGPLESFIPEIHIFDWSGNPIAKCTPDHNFIMYDIDSEGRYLYTSSLFDENIIRRYDLSKVLPK